LLATTTGRKSPAAQSLRSALIRWLVYIAVFGLIMRGTDNLRSLSAGLWRGYLLGRVMAESAAVRRQRAQARQSARLGCGLRRNFASFGFMVLKYLQNI